jgi:5-methylcytosine-specific restriction endonuclease McrA
MELRHLTQDQKERILIEAEEAIAGLKAIQLQVLEDLDRDQVATADGCRTLSEWVAGRLDLGTESAKSLVRTMRRTADRPDLREALASGEITFDRVEAVSRIAEHVGYLEELDVAGVRREAALLARVTAETEYRTAQDRFLVLQPTLDESWWKGFFGLDGASGAIVDKVISEMADHLPESPDGTGGGSSWRKATALLELCTSDEPLPAQVTVFIDAANAVDSNGETGVVLEAGPRIGSQALQAILCDAVTEITVTAHDGIPMSYGRRSRTIPPALRRAILHRDGDQCAGDGCPSSHRLQVHHIRPWSEGGPTDPDNLITLCWFHHQIVVHERGFIIYRHPDTGRIRFGRPELRGPPG